MCWTHLHPSLFVVTEFDIVHIPYHTWTHYVIYGLPLKEFRANVIFLISIDKLLNLLFWLLSFWRPSRLSLVQHVLGNHTNTHTHRHTQTHTHRHTDTHTCRIIVRFQKGELCRQILPFLFIWLYNRHDKKSLKSKQRRNMNIYLLMPLYFFYARVLY